MVARLGNHYTLESLPLGLLMQGGFGVIW